MKRLLLGSTALATIGLVAGMVGDARADSRIKVGVHGFHQQWGVYANQDIDTVPSPDGSSNRIKTSPVDQKHNSEICLVGESTLDNGITFGLNVQLEANTERDQVDESYLYVQSNTLGRLIVGDENNAAYLLHVTAPDGGISVDAGDMIDNEFWANTGITDYKDTAIGGTELRFNDNDSGKFTYISPRFVGFQLGASFIPQFEPGGGDDNSSAYKMEIAGKVTKDTQRNGVAVGANFKQDFNGFGVQASAGWLGAEMTGNNLSAGSFGAQLSYAGFTVGGAYAVGVGTRSVDDSGNEATEFDSQSWIGGATYEIGPYKVGVNYMRGWGDTIAATSNDQRLDQANISGTYQFGPGIHLVGGFFAYDLDASRPGIDGFDNNGWGFASGIKLGF